MIQPEKFEITDYLNKVFSCNCGREHQAPIRQIIIEAGAVNRLPEVLKQASFHRAFLLYDLTTYSAAGQKVNDVLKESGFSYSFYILDDREPVPDERTIGSVLIHLDSQSDVIIGIGTGTINDTCRFISYKLHLPYIITATAPSMDGFASNVAPLIVNHMKTTYEAHAPYAIIGDIDLLKEAPMEMINAGIGDILGKYTCLCDWKIANILLGQYYCDTVVEMVNHSIKTVMNNVGMAKERDPKAIASIMEALVLSGIAMSFVGNSRPASGSEHHLSHYWEMMFLFEGKKPVLHGAKVGIATVAVLKAYELLFKRDIDFNAAAEKILKYSTAKWEDKMKEAYGPAASSVISLEKTVKKNAPDKILSQLKSMDEHWNSMKAAADNLPSADYIRQILESLQAPADPMSVGVDKKTFINSFIAAKELRNRFGLLQILFDLGLSEEIALEVWDYFQEKTTR